MDDLVRKYLELTGGGKKLPIITEDEIVFGRVCLKVQPSVEAEDAEVLLMEFPVDLVPDEAALPMAFKACLAGYEGLMPLMGRIRDSLGRGRDHVERLGVWKIRCSERGRFQTIEARRVP